MKFIVISLFLSYALIASSSFKELGYETNYNTALKKAKDQNKQIVMVLVSSHCPWCERLEEEVLFLEYTNELLQKNYIPLVQYSGGDEFPAKFDSYVVPTIHFIDSKNESLIESIYGFNNNWRFYEIIEANK